MTSDRFTLSHHICFSNDTKLLIAKQSHSTECDKDDCCVLADEDFLLAIRLSLIARNYDLDIGSS